MIIHVVPPLWERVQVVHHTKLCRGEALLHARHVFLGIAVRDLNVVGPLHEGIVCNLINQTIIVDSDALQIVTRKEVMPLER